MLTCGTTDKDRHFHPLKAKPGRKKATKPCLHRLSVDPTNVAQPPPIIDDQDEQEEPAPEKTRKANI